MASRKAKSAPHSKKKKKSSAKPAKRRASISSKSKKSKSPAAKSKSTRGGKSARTILSPITGLPVREKIHLPIKGFGRFNGFQVLENLFGKTPAQLKEILAYEEKHQARRMVIDRINDMLRRYGK